MMEGGNFDPSEMMRGLGMLPEGDDAGEEADGSDDAPDAPDGDEDFTPGGAGTFPFGIFGGGRQQPASAEEMCIRDSHKTQKEPKTVNLL